MYMVFIKRCIYSFRRWLLPEVPLSFFFHRLGYFQVEDEALTRPALMDRIVKHYIQEVRTSLFSPGPLRDVGPKCLVFTNPFDVVVGVGGMLSCGTRPHLPHAP